MTTRFDSPAALLDKAGTHLGTTEWRSITQQQVDSFADATDDHQWIHVDAERAKAGPFGTTIAHGYLTLALAPVILSEVVEVAGAGMVVNYGTNKVRFPHPVPVGSRVRGSVDLVGAVARHGGIEATFALTVELEGADRPACVAEVVTLFR